MVDGGGGGGRVGWVEVEERGVNGDERVRVQEDWCGGGREGLIGVEE